VHDIVGLYLNPRDRALALCVDEKSQIHVRDRTALVAAASTRTPELRTHDYVRGGTSSP